MGCMDRCNIMRTIRRMDRSIFEIDAAESPHTDTTIYVQSLDLRERGVEFEFVHMCSIEQGRNDLNPTEIALDSRVRDERATILRNRKANKQYSMQSRTNSNASVCPYDRRPHYDLE